MLVARNAEMARAALAAIMLAGLAQAALAQAPTLEDPDQPATAAQVPEDGEQDAASREPYDTGGSDFTKNRDDLSNRLELDARKTDVVIPTPFLDPARETWEGFKQGLSEDFGFNFGFFYTTLYQKAHKKPTGSLAGSGKDEAFGGNFSFLGSWELFARDTEHPDTLYFHVRDPHNLITTIPPTSLAGEIGSLWPTTVFYEDFSFHPTELFWEQSVVKDMFVLRLGLQESFDTHDYLSHKSPVDGFQNGALGFNPSISFTEPGLGAAMLVRPVEEVYLIGGFYDANAMPNSFGFETFDDGEYLKMVDVGWDPGFLDPNRDVSLGPIKLRDIHATFWHKDERKQAGEPQGYGLTLSAEVQIGDFLPFFRYGFSDGTGAGNPATAEETIAAGVVITDVFGQNNDAIGLGFATATPATGAPSPVDFNADGVIDFDLNDVAREVLPDRQYAAEAFYRIQFTDELQITPSVQLFWDPILNTADAIVWPFAATATTSARHLEESMNRRSILKYLAVGGAAACPLCRYLAGDALAAEKGHRWGYAGDAGPEHWGSLSADYQSCSAGAQQSPIDLSGAVRAELSDVAVAYADMPLKILNNGHTVQCNAAPGSGIEVEGTRYELLQFHFHHPSEHTVDGKAFEMEAHFVHKSAAGTLAVLGVMIQPGQANAALAPIFEAMPMKMAEEREVAGLAIGPAQILPANRAHYRYFGSLTTPPCSEGVHWMVLKAPIEASTQQIARFAEAFPLNARPVQKRNRRFLLRSG